MNDPTPYAEMEETLGFEGPYVDPPARRRSAMLTVSLAIVTGLVTTVVIVGVLATTPPAWWPAPAVDQDAARTRAREIENTATRLASQVRNPDEPWSVLLKQTDANTWLEQRLRPWVETTFAPWPDDVGRIAVRFEQGQLVIGAALGARGIASFVLEPSIGPDQLARIALREVRFNRVVIPRTVAERRLSASIAQALQRDQHELAPLLAALQGEPIPEPPVLALGDGRRVHLVGIESREGELVLHCQTRSPARSAQR